MNDLRRTLDFYCDADKRTVATARGVDATITLEAAQTLWLTQYLKLCMPERLCCLFVFQEGLTYAN